MRDDIDDFEESPEYLDKLWDSIGSNDKAYSVVDYHQQPKYLPKPQRVEVDTRKWYDEDPDELRKLSAKSIINPHSAEFNYTLHYPKAQTEPVMYGNVNTPTEKILLLGFTKWREFETKIVDGSQPLAKQIRDRLIDNANQIYTELGCIRLTYWLPREKNYSCRGYWAIIVDEPKKRTIIHNVNGALYYNENLAKIIRNQIKIRGTN
jgi:hypothetical protein